MMNRITLEDLDRTVDSINKAQDTPCEPWSCRDIDGKYIGNIGNYHLGSAYGGWSLQQMMNEQGGVRDVFQVGHVPKRRLYDLLRAYRAGFTAGTGGRV